MPIKKIVSGNLIRMFKAGEVGEIVQGANCFHVMGAGIAGQIAMEFPEAYEADLLTPYGVQAKLGTCSVATTRFGQVINAYTQYRPGIEPSGRLYESIRKAFVLLNNRKLNRPSLITGIPRIGCGIAGGDWNEVSKIIDEVTPNMNILLVDYDNS